MPGDTVQVNLKSLFITLGVVIVAIVFALGALANGDPLWFWPVFDETPSRIAVYRNGCRAEVGERQPEFERFKNALNGSLTHVDGFSSSYGLSPETLQDYRAKETSLEVFYRRPVTVHSPYRFGRPDSLFIPLTGYFGESRAVFGGLGGQYWAGALRLKSLDAIRQAADHIPCPR